MSIVSFSNDKSAPKAEASNKCDSSWRNDLVIKRNMILVVLKLRKIRFVDVIN